MVSSAAVQKLDQLPPEMLEFTLLTASSSLAPRLGRLSLAGRKSIPTPAFIGNTSRGVLPHISPDNFRKSAVADGVYVAIEDFIEKHPQKIPPVFNYNVPEPLRQFIALPQDTLIVLGARRNPPIPSPQANTNAAVGLLTSVGFNYVSSEYYASAAQKLRPDIVVGLADIPFGQASIAAKRKDKMSDRTENWLRDIVAKKSALEKGERGWAIFAPILPIERNSQSWYLNHLVDNMVDQVDGLAIYDTDSLQDLPEQLQDLPRLSFDAPSSPHTLLRQVGLGIDIFTVPFLNDATDAGIALDFTFPAPTKSGEASKRQILGADMWSEDHAVSVTPLSKGCTCYACTKHHRAYIQHLLSAKEMLGWVLLQLHNHATISAFFAGARASIEGGTFDVDVTAFAAYYEPDLPEKTGQGPRVRGYQFKSEAHAKKERKNPKAFKRFSEDEIVKLRAAHGQQPNNKPETRNLIDDEALLGLVEMGESTIEADPTMQVQQLKLDDDAKP
ncbi:hypothetical protein ACN47E_009680 [Coniothyrium glycines]